MSETAVSEWHEGNSSGSDEDLPNRENLSVRPLSWQRSIEVNGLMASWTAKLRGVKANEVKIMVIEHTVRPASNQGAPEFEFEFEFALAPDHLQ